MAVTVLSGGVVASGSPGSLQRAPARGVWQARVLPGDRLMAGPVMLGHRAIWVEAGQRLRVRSLDARGHTRTIFSTAATPGAPKGTPWPFYVPSLAAGDGRVAFVEEVIPCASAPPSLARCTPGSGAPSADSVTLFAGRPAAIRPMESVLHPRGCHGGPEPDAVGVADAGLVDYEQSAFPCARGVSRLVLRTFSGRLVRVLARGLPIVTPFVAAGPWVALIRRAQLVGQPDRLQIIRAATGKVVLRLGRSSPSEAIDAVTIDPSGRYVLTTVGGSTDPCQPKRRFAQLNVGQIGHAGTELLTSSANPLGTATSLGVAIAGDRVAYGQPAGRCLASTQVVIGAPGVPPTPVPGVAFGIPLAFDGHLVASAHRQFVQLARISEIASPLAGDATLRGETSRHPGS